MTLQEAIYQASRQAVHEQLEKQGAFSIRDLWHKTTRGVRQGSRMVRPMASVGGILEDIADVATIRPKVQMVARAREAASKADALKLLSLLGLGGAGAFGLYGSMRLAQVPNNLEIYSEMMRKRQG